MTDKNPKYVEIGDKYLLWITKYSREAYEDQFGIKNKGYIVLEQIEVTVVEIKNNVRDMWTDKEEHLGWKATSESGELFQCNWVVFPSDSMSPTYYWDAINSRNGVPMQPVDAVQAYNYHQGSIPMVLNNERAIPKTDYIEVCEKHKHAIYKRTRFAGDGTVFCFKCRMGR